MNPFFIMVMIPDNELTITFARSSGAGGQNVNKASTKVIIHWLVGKSFVLSEEEKTRIRTKLANRINNEDELVVVSEEERSQLQNRELAVGRLQELVNEAVHVPKVRRATRPTRSSKLKRLESKKMHSQIKTARKSLE